MMNPPALTYRQLAVQGATPVGLIVMLYDGAISAMQRAISAMEAHDIEKRCAHLNRVLGIIIQLEGVLDLERGGEVAQTLKRFYVHARARLLQASVENSQEILASLAQQFSIVREAWQQVETAGSSSGTPAPTPNDPRPTPTPSPTTERESTSWSA
jgi:flagellar protein FliS